METTIIISFCALLLIAYLFDLTSSKTRIPSVILLLFLGWFIKQITDFLDIPLPVFSELLPLFGTIGLILIVLEGSLELEFNKSNLGLIKKSFFGALIPMLALSFILAYLFQQYGTGDYTFKSSLINAIPFCIVSTAIAIPSVKYLSSKDKGFVIYESSFSEITGVVFFNFISLNEHFGFYSFGSFGLQVLIIFVISFISTIGLSFLLSKIEHQIKFVPIILLVILIYAVSKTYHLPALIFIMIFGLSIGNLDELKSFKWIERFKPDELNREVIKFRELVVEATFVIKALFFILFGYLIETSEIFNTETLKWSLGIVAAMYIFRAAQLKLSGLALNPLLFVAPRGLITILLFISILPAQNIDLVNRSMIIQVIIITALIMMFGLMATNRQKN
ncbi:MAG: cation:proton antiporter [Chitinophagales bacterium]